MVFPNLLIATTSSANSLTLHNSAALPYGLKVGLIWFILGMALATTYTVYMYRSFWGKVELPAEHGGY